MKIDITHYFDVDIETFEKALYDPELDKRLKQLPNLLEREVLEEKDDGKFLRRKVRCLAAGPIPKIATKVIKPHMLSWEEESVFDKRRHIIEWKVTSYFFKKYLDCHGIYALYPDGKKRMRREVKGELNVKVAGVGRFAAQYIIKYFMKNSQEEYEVMKKFIEEKYIEKHVNSIRKSKTF